MTPAEFRIQELREVKGWSQAELSRRSGVPQPTISRLETGSRQAVNLEILEKLADALGCDPGYLIVKKR